LQNFIGDSIKISAVWLLYCKLHKLQWSEDAQHAFMDLNQRFTSAPILKQADPELPFIVEMDASEC